MTWAPGGSTADAIAVFRAHVPPAGLEYVEGWQLVARVPASAHEWTDSSLRAEQSYAYAVQPTSAAGGTAASSPLVVTTPPTLVYDLDKGLVRHRYVGRWCFCNRGRLRLRGALRTTDGGALPDIRTAGLTLVVAKPSYSRPREVLVVPPNSPAWRERREGRLSWRSGRSRVRIDETTGAIDVHVSPLRGDPIPPIEDLTEQVRIDIYGETRFQLLIGNDVGSFTPTWRKVRKHKARAR